MDLTDPMISTGMEQRVLLLRGQESLLLYGDSEEGDERLWRKERRQRVGAALPAYLAEGWSIRQITPVPVEGETDPIAYAVIERPAL